MIFDKFSAIVSLRQGASFEIDEKGIINWLDKTQTEPTSAEIDAEVARLQADYDAKQYQRDRAAAYPSIQEQLDMQYWDSVNGTTTWKDAIEAVKVANPKPE